MASGRRHSIKSQDGDDDGGVTPDKEKTRTRRRSFCSDDEDEEKLGAVSGAVNGAVGGAVNGAVGGAVDGAVGGAVDGAVGGAVGGAEGGRRRSIGSEADQSQIQEVEDLKRRGILPFDFPSSIGDQTKYDEDDMAEEITELLKQGVISKQTAERFMRDNKLTVESDTIETNAGERIVNEFTKAGLPVNWTKVIDKDQTYELVDLSVGDPEFETIREEFRNENIELKKVQRLQNVRLLDRYKSEMEDMKRHRSSAFDLNVRYLYHGTNVPLTRLCEEGLDQRLSRMGYFGRGIYFSDSPIKCIHYADDSSKPDEAFLLKCRVILGDSKAYPNKCYDTTLKREPEKENQTNGWRYYDSVVGCPKDQSEFVVYENRRAMIEYIISFNLDRAAVSQLVDSNPPPDTQSAAGGDDTCEPITDETQFQAMAEIREIVRKKRAEEKGLVYQPPSQEQVNKDRELWMRLQKVHADLPRMYRENNINPLVPQPGTNPHTGIPGLGIPPVSFSQREVDPVEQVLNSCIEEFLAVTNTTDRHVAIGYVQTAKMDLNYALVLYYETHH